MTTSVDLMPRQFWATPFYQRLWPGHSAEAPEIIAHWSALKAQEPDRIASGVASAAKSATGLFESNFDPFASSHAGLARFVALAAKSVRSAAAHVNGARVDPDRRRVTFPDSCIDVATDGGFTTLTTTAVAPGAASIASRPAIRAAVRSAGRRGGKIGFTSCTVNCHTAANGTGS